MKDSGPDPSLSVPSFLRKKWTPSGPAETTGEKLTPPGLLPRVLPSSRKGFPETLKVLRVRSRRCPTCQTLAPNTPNTPFCPASFVAGKVGPRTNHKGQQAGTQAVSRSELRAAQGGEGAGPRPGDGREQGTCSVASGLRGTGHCPQVQDVNPQARDSDPLGRVSDLKSLQPREFVINKGTAPI